MASLWANITLLAFLVLFCPGSPADEVQDGLQFVTVIFRHGDRTPISPYPTDPYKDLSNWPVGFGQLTPKGKRMQYGLGQYFRNRYGSLVGLQYNESKIYVRSTDVDRTLMSALSNLAGFFPPSGQQVWNDQLPWQPVPVHTVPLGEDALLSSHSHCPRMQEAIDEVMSSAEVTTINSKNSKLFEYMTKHSGENITDMIKVDYIFDTLFIEQLYNFTLPEWTRSVYPSKLKWLRDLSFTITTWTHELKRLRSGPIITEILTNMQKVVAKQDEYALRKMNMYSAHDTTIASFLNALSLFDPIAAPPYIATVMIELHKRADTHFVRFLYRNETDRDPFVLTLPGCSSDCPLEQFEALTRPLRPLDWEAECRSTRGSDDDPAIVAVTYVSVIICSGLVVVLLVAVAMTCLRKRQETAEDHQYLSVNQDLA